MYSIAIDVEFLLHTHSVEVLSSICVAILDLVAFFAVLLFLLFLFIENQYWISFSIFSAVLNVLKYYNMHNKTN